MSEDIEIKHKQEVESGDFASPSQWNDNHVIEDFAIQSNHLENEILVPDHFQNQIIESDVLAFTPHTLSQPHTAWSEELDDEEIQRIDLQPGEQLRVERLEVQKKGGGSDTDFSIDVYELDNDNILRSANAGQTNNSPIASEPGTTILVRVNNSKNEEVSAGYKIHYSIIT